MSDAYLHGSWNVICDRCGFKYKAHQLRTEWTGLKTCSGPATNNCWEVKHPQLSVKGRIDQQSPPWVRPDTSVNLTLLDMSSASLTDSSGVPITSSTSAST